MAGIGNYSVVGQFDLDTSQFHSAIMECISDLRDIEENTKALGTISASVVDECTTNYAKLKDSMVSNAEASANSNQKIIESVKARMEYEKSSATSINDSRSAYSVLMSVMSSTNGILKVNNELQNSNSTLVKETSTAYSDLLSASESVAEMTKTNAEFTKNMGANVGEVAKQYSFLLNNSREFTSASTKSFQDIGMSITDVETKANAFGGALLENIEYANKLRGEMVEVAETVARISKPTLMTNTSGANFNALNNSLEQVIEKVTRGKQLMENWGRENGMNLLDNQMKKFSTDLTTANGCFEKIGMSISDVEAKAKASIDGMNLSIYNIVDKTELLSDEVQKVGASAIKTGEEMRASFTSGFNFSKLDGEIDKYVETLKRAEAEDKKFRELNSQNMLTGGMASLDSEIERAITDLKITNTCFKNIGMSISDVEAKARASTGAMDMSISNATQLAELLTTNIKEVGASAVQTGEEMRASFTSGFDFSKLDGEIDKYVATLKRAEAEDIRFRQLNEENTRLTNIGGGMASLDRTIERLGMASIGEQNYGRNILKTNQAIEEQVIANREQASTMNNVVSSVNRSATGMSRYQSETNKSKNANAQLTRSFSTLRMVGSFVGTMFAFTLVNDLINSVQATLEAKSEMESYEHQLHKTNNEIDNFDEALNKCIQEFPKMNKYQLGETVASLGVEFNLTNQEMKETLKVVPMIVNEYLRAGRTFQEADLAVKDIAQGQFQRLSRETGVGKEDLKAAGWNGNNKDIMSLMSALEKVGKSRNWDKFAQKATSLSDVLMITQNRISEFATDLMNVATPMIVNGFNMIDGAINSLSHGFQALPEWGQWGIDAGVITVTLMGLANVIQGRLIPAITKSISSRLASLTGLDSEIAKERGYASALAEESMAQDMQVASMEANNTARITQISNIQKQARACKEAGETEKALALTEEAEGMINEDLAIEESVTRVQRQLGISTTEAQIGVEEILMQTRAMGIEDTVGLQIAERQLAIAHMSTGKAMASSILGLDAYTTATKGLGASFVQTFSKSSKLMSEMTALQYASLGTADKIKALSKAFLGNPVMLGKVAGIMAIAVGVMLLGQYLESTTSEMKGFNNVLKNGQENIQSTQEAIKGYKSQLADLNSEKQKEIANGKSTVETDARIKQANDSLTKSYSTLQSEVNSYNKAKEIKTNADTRLDYMKKQGTNEKNQMLVKKGLLSQAEYNSINQNGFNAIAVTKQYGHALDEFSKRQSKANNHLKGYADQLKETGQSTEQQKQSMQEMSSLQDDYNEKIYEWDTASSGSEKLQAGLEAFLDAMFIGLDDIWTICQQIWTAIAPTLQSFFEWLFPKGYEVTDLARDIWGVLVQIGGAWNNTVAWFESGFAYIQGAWNNTIKWLNDGWNSFVNPIKSGLAWLQGAWNNTVSFFQKLWHDITYPIGQGVKQVRKWVADVQHALDKTGVPKALTDLISDYHQLAHNIHDAYNWLVRLNGLPSPKSFQGGGIKNSNGSQNIGADLLYSLTHIKSSYKLQLPTLETSSASDPSKYYNSGKANGEARTQGFKAGDKTQLTQQQIDQANTNGTNNPKYHQSGNSSGKSWVDGLRSGLMNAPNVARQKLSGVSSSITSQSRTWGSDIQSGARNVVSKLGSGLNGMGSTATSKLNQVNSAILSHAPSWAVHTYNNAKKSADRFKNGIKPMHKSMGDEMRDVLNAVVQWGTQIINKAKWLGGQISNAFAHSGLGRNSPGLLYKNMYAELGSVHDAFGEKQEIILAKARELGTRVSGAYNGNVGLNAPQLNQQAISTSQQVAQTNTQTANATVMSYNQMRNQAGITLNQMGTQAKGIFNGISNNNGQYLNKVKNDTNTGYKQAHSYTQDNLNKMKTTTLSATRSMVSAWGSMRGSIVNSASQIQKQSYSKFSSLHRSIGTFYNHLATAHFSSGLPMGNGSGSSNFQIGTTGSNTGGRLSFGYSSSGSNSSIRKEMWGRSYGKSTSKKNSLKFLELLKNPKQNHVKMQQLALEEGYDPNDENNMFGSSWLNSIRTNYLKIKNTADKWSIADPYFLGIQIPMNNYVRDFEDGKTKQITMGNFEPILRHLLTVRGFRNPATYEHYANSIRTNQEVWDSVRCNCYDGAEMIVEIAQMLGLPASLVHGRWGNEGHMGAMVGGQLFDMTQFQSRGVFRGTSGVYFGGSSSNQSIPHGGDNGEPVVTKNETHIHIDMSNSTILDKDEWVNDIDKIAQKVFFREQGVNPATGV